jgi:Na+-driven multidrug efflux pump
MKTTDTALLGHVSRDALSAAALSDLWTMCTAMLIQGRALDVLVGGAMGAGNPKLAGIYLQVAYAVISVVAVGVFICWNLTERIWVAFGSDSEISQMAGYYARILSLTIPGQLLFTQLSQFFSAQRIMRPEVNASTCALVLNLVLGLIFVLGIPFPNFEGYGFAACPIVTSSAVYVQILVLWYFYIHKQRLHEPAWGGWSLKEITWERIKTFSALYFPSAFGIASDFWRVAVSEYYYLCGTCRTTIPNRQTLTQPFCCSTSWHRGCKIGRRRRRCL